MVKSRTWASAISRSVRSNFPSVGGSNAPHRCVALPIDESGGSLENVIEAWRLPGRVITLHVIGLTGRSGMERLDGRYQHRQPRAQLTGEGERILRGLFQGVSPNRSHDGKDILHD